MANIFKKAKQLRNKHPRKFKTFQQAVKAAGKQMRGTKRKKKVGSINMPSRKHTDYNRNKVDISIGSLSSHKAAIKRILDRDIDSAVIRRHKATKKTDRRKLTKKISELTREKRKFL